MRRLARGAPGPALGSCLALAALCLALVACGSRGGQAFPAFALTNQSGESVSGESLRGHATVVTFIFTNCRDVCPLLTTQLVRLQSLAKAEGLGSRVRFVSVTVDPATDTPPVLKRYALGHGADLASWDFLTGSPEEIRRLVDAVGLLTGTGDRIGHSNLVLLVDRRGHVAERSADVDLDPAGLLPKLRRLAA